MAQVNAITTAETMAQRLPGRTACRPSGPPMNSDAPATKPSSPDGACTDASTVVTGTSCPEAAVRQSPGAKACCKHEQHIPGRDVPFRVCRGLRQVDRHVDGRLSCWIIGVSDRDGVVATLGVLMRDDAVAGARAVTGQPVTPVDDPAALVVVVPVQPDLAAALVAGVGTQSVRRLSRRTATARAATTGTTAAGTAGLASGEVAARLGCWRRRGRRRCTTDRVITSAVLWRELRDREWLAVVVQVAVHVELPQLGHLAVRGQLGARLGTQRRRLVPGERDHGAGRDLTVRAGRVLSVSGVTVEDDPAVLGL